MLVEKYFRVIFVLRKWDNCGILKRWKLRRALAFLKALFMVKCSILTNVNANQFM